MDRVKDTDSTADRERAVILGWLRGVAEPLGPLLEGSCEPLLEPASDNGELSDRLESFARPLLAVSPWLDGRTVELFPDSADFASAARATLLRGVDPGDECYWGEMEDYSQPICEASSLAWCLHNARGALWEPLGGRRKEQVARWLAQVDGRKVNDTNWQLFPSLVQAFLHREGFAVNEAEMRGRIRRVFEDLHAGRGWYRDGVEEAFDTYNGNQIQPYLMMLDELGVCPEFSEELRKRVPDFLDVLLEMFDEEGVAPVWGRSILYRLTFLDGLAMALRRGFPVRRPGEWRRAVAGAFRRLPLNAITDREGLLLPGFIGRKEDILDSYSCRGSAYWLGRLCHLAQVEPESPFWNDTPSGTFNGGVRVFSPLPLAVNRCPRHVVLWNLGIDHHAYSGSKYYHLLLSGRFGQAYGSGAGALCFNERGNWRPFNRFRTVETSSRRATVEGSAAGRRIRVEFSAGKSGASRIEIRKLSGDPIEIRLGGFAVSGKLRETDAGLSGVEGLSGLETLEGFGQRYTEGKDGVHLWARDFSYPAVRTVLGDSPAAAAVEGVPGNWNDVLVAYCGD